MLILDCPYCGIACDETELSPGGEAHLTRFGPGSSDDEFEGYLFMRENPRGVHFERWRHSHGCGKWSRRTGYGHAGGLWDLSGPDVFSPR